tara:strand:+ start:4446 stop:5606 length:1161 start_codon:yes stop_codon:yes gene_type:complete
MTHQIDLPAAVDAGIISPDQATDLVAFSNRALLQSVADTSRATDDRETFRLIGGFNDIFVTIGIVLLLAGAAFSLDSVVGRSMQIQFTIMAGLIWLLAEYISRVKRMKLPSTVLALGFLFYISSLLQIWLTRRFDFAEPENALAALVLLDQGQMAGLISFSVILVVSAIYFWRFRVPVQAAVIALAATGLVTVAASELFMDEVARGQVQLSNVADVMLLIQRLLVLPLICGLVIFATGIYLDFKDRNRLSTLSDAAFWLHLISAPMIVHPLFILSSGQDVGFGTIEPGVAATAGLVSLMVVIVLISLAIDRRALLIPTLTYFGALGIYRIVANASDSTGIPAFALVLLVIGALIIIFGMGWQRIRRIVIGSTLPHRWLAALPPIKA